MNFRISSQITTLQHSRKAVGYEDVLLLVFFLPNGDLFDLDDRDDFLLLLPDDRGFDFGSPSSSRSSSSSSRGEGMRLSRIFGNGFTSIVTGSKEELANVSFSGDIFGLAFLAL